MSYDVYVQDFSDVKTVDEITSDFEPKPLGPRSQIIEKIVSVFPNANFSEPNWGVIETEDGSIEINIGEKEPCDTFMLHVRGGQSAFPAVASILKAVGVRAIDCQTGEFYNDSAGKKSFSDWHEFRDKVVGEYADPPNVTIWSKLRQLFGKSIE